MDPYPRTHPLVRGGFSPLQSGNWTPRSGMAGLGDVCSPNDLSCQMSGTTNIDPSTGLPIDVEALNSNSSNILSQIPTSLWLLMGGFVAFALLVPTSYKR